MSFFESESERAQRENNEGQADGSSNGLIGHLLHDCLGSLLSSEQYNAGYDNGRNNPSRSSTEQSTEAQPNPKTESSTSDYDRDDSDSRCSNDSPSREGPGILGALVIAFVVLIACAGVVIVVLFISSSSSSDSTAPSSQAEPSVSAKQRQLSAAEESARKHLAQANTELDLLYYELIVLLPPNEQKALQEAQRDWVSLRDAEADRIARSNSSTEDAYQLAFIIASTDLTKKRIEYLKHYRDRLSIVPPVEPPRLKAVPAQPHQIEPAPRPASPEDAFRQTVRRLSRF